VLASERRRGAAGGDAVIVRLEEALVVLLEAATAGVEGPGRWPWFSGGAEVPRRCRGLR
jgi:hypothetical protein